MKERILVSGCQDEGKGYDTQLLYFTCSSLSHDDRRLYLISDRDGNPNVYVKDLENGEEKQDRNVESVQVAQSQNTGDHFTVP